MLTCRRSWIKRWPARIRGDLSGSLEGTFQAGHPREELSVLDVGCSTGEMSRMLADMGHKVMGIDLSEKMLTVAKSKAPGSIEFRIGDAENPPSTRENLMRS